MVIQHNLISSNTNRQLNTVTSALSKATEKLSSGYKINRAGDDAAGLSISEKMRAQIKGLTKASDNIQDGISLIQVAEGALAESHSILQRMNELATQAANDSNTDTDRAALQAEIDQLASELNRTADSTSFNKDLYPLLGNYVLPDSIQGVSFPVVNNSTGNMIIDGVTYGPGTTVTLNNVLQLNINGRTSTVIAQVDESTGYGSGITSSSSFTINGSASETTIKYCTLSDAYITDDGNIAVNTPFGVMYASNNGQWTPSKTNLVQAVEEEKYIQAGSIQGQAISIPFVNAKAGNLNVDTCDLSTYETAGEAMEKIQNAINTVSSWRSTFGAVQNRLTHAYNIDTYTSENTQSAESRIRDTDMATEMVEYSKDNILNNAGQSMLAQANSIADYVLSLLNA